MRRRKNRKESLVRVSDRQKKHSTSQDIWERVSNRPFLGCHPALTNLEDGVDVVRWNRPNVFAQPTTACNAETSQQGNSENRRGECEVIVRGKMPARHAAADDDGKERCAPCNSPDDGRNVRHVPYRLTTQGRCGILCRCNRQPAWLSHASCREGLGAYLALQS